jgi:hypothetical protein
MEEYGEETGTRTDVGLLFPSTAIIGTHPDIRGCSIKGN